MLDPWKPKPRTEGLRSGATRHAPRCRQASSWGGEVPYGCSLMTPVRSAPESAVHAEQQFPWGLQTLARRARWAEATSVPPVPLRFDRTRAGEVSAQVTVIHAPGRDHCEDEIDDTLERVVAQQGHAGFEGADGFTPLEMAGVGRVTHPEHRRWSCPCVTRRTSGNSPASTASA